jgi:hypothetical protein
MGDELVTALIPVLAEPTQRDFNVFDVLHHGTHEKQISNLFAWLLDPDETHHLGCAFQRIFVDEINQSLPSDQRVVPGDFSVRQEVNTSPVGEAADIADLVLESESTVIVVENYQVSDGHGHSYQRYRDFGARDGKTSVVAMLCGKAVPGALVDGWQDAPVLTYGALIERLIRKVQSDQSFQLENQHQMSLFDQMQQHFGKGRRVNEDNLNQFISAVCASGEAKYFGQNSHEMSAVNFADMLRDRALHQFSESREFLGRVKTELRAYCAETLKRQVNEALGEEFLEAVSARYQGIFEWTVNFHAKAQDMQGKPLVQIKFGPSAWESVAVSDYWQRPGASVILDYRRLFLTDDVSRRVTQSTVTMMDVLSGLSPDDMRLRDELVDVLNSNRVE